MATVILPWLIKLSCDLWITRNQKCTAFKLQRMFMHGHNFQRITRLLLPLKMTWSRCHTQNRWHTYNCTSFAVTGRYQWLLIKRWWYKVSIGYRPLVKVQETMDGLVIGSLEQLISDSCRIFPSPGRYLHLWCSKPCNRDSIAVSIPKQLVLWPTHKHDKLFNS